MATKLPFEEFKKIYSRVPRLCLDLVVKNENGVLLTLRDIPPAKGLWHIPGGTMLFDENIDEAIQRIAGEELGTSVRVKKLLGYIDWYKTKNANGHAVSMEFLVEPLGGITVDYQASHFKFFKKIPPKTIKEHVSFLLSLD